MSQLGDVKTSDGEVYTFEVYPKETKFKALAGVYMFTRRESNEKHTILYIGETGSFRDRPLGWNHHKWGSATRMGLTHIWVLQTSNGVAIEKKLIDTYKPPLNEK